MEPKLTIAPKEWMTAPATRAVVAALEADGAPARFVGGCVRDTLMGRPVRDIDIATPESPERVTALLARAGIRAVPTGIAHGTVTAVKGGKPFEVTTLRRDVETFGRHARVAFTDDWTEDAARRDFTINALFLDVAGRVFDPVDGLADIEARRVRFVGDARTRIEEDVLRLLRFFRFFAHFDRPPPDAEALVACKEMAPKLPSLSGERVRAELLKLLEALAPAATLALMAEEGILTHVLAEARDFPRLAALVRIERDVLARPADPLLRLGGVLDGGAAAVAARLRLSNKERDRLIGMEQTDMAEAEEAPSRAFDDRALHRAIYVQGAECFADRLLLAWAGEAARGDTDDSAWAALLARAEAWPPPPLPIKGEDAVKMGVAPGPEVGRLVKAVEAWWIEEDFGPDRAACLARLETLVAESNPASGASQGRNRTNKDRA
jgi:poly(A) polymerase